MNWVKATDTQGDTGKITGHHIYMDDGAGGDFSVVLVDAGYPDTTDHTVGGTSITKRFQYRFYLVLENAMGFSAFASDIATYFACENPSTLAAPKIISITSTVI